MIVGALFTCLLYTLILYTNTLHLSLLYIAFFFVGFFFTGQCLCFPAACDVTPSYASGTTIGFINSLVMTSGVIAHPIVGKLLDLSWTGQTNLSGTPIYSAESFERALTFIPIALFIALLFALFMKESYPKKIS